MRTPHVSPDPRAVAIALFVVLVALAVVVIYLARLLTEATRRADAAEMSAAEWENEWWNLHRRNSQLASALELTTDVVSGVVADLSATCNDDQIIARAEFLAAQADLPAADVQRFVDDVERHANTRDNH